MTSRWSPVVSAVLLAAWTSGVSGQCNNAWPPPPLFTTTQSPCYPAYPFNFPTLPPPPPPLPLPLPQPQPSACRGCPDQYQLPSLFPLPAVYPEVPPGEQNRLINPDDRIYIKETKVTRIPSPLDEKWSESKLVEKERHFLNVSQHGQPIVPQVSSYRPHNQYYGQFLPQPFGCYRPDPMPLPAPLPPPPPPPPPPMPLPPLQCCPPCPVYFNRHALNPKAQARASKTAGGKAARCTNQKLRELMEKFKHLPIADARLEVQREAELFLNDGYYHVLCSTTDLEYVTRSESFCTEAFADGICYAFRTQRFF